MAQVREQPATIASVVRVKIRAIVATVIIVALVVAGVLVAIYVPQARTTMALFIVHPAVAQAVLILTAFATTAAVVVALTTSARAQRTQDDRDRADTAAKLERRAERQAVLIAVRNGGSASGAGMGGLTHYSVQIDNNSDRPIYDAVVSGRFQVGTTPQDTPGDGGIPFIAAGTSGGREVLALDPATSAIYLASGATFRDAFGDTWTLHSGGALTLDHSREIGTIEVPRARKQRLGRGWVDSV